jgi:adenylosuccinate synthase
VRICTGYRRNGQAIDLLPFGADDVAGCEPVYEDMPGWSESTFGVRAQAALPAAARRYLERLSELVDAPIDMVSTGPDRDETILLRHPFDRT